MNTESAKPVAFVSHEVDGKTYSFNRPTTAQIDHAVSRMRKTALSAALDFSRATVMEADRSSWEVLLNDKPGAAIAVLNVATQKLGFPAE
jgi:hypothetical protein